MLGSKKLTNVTVGNIAGPRTTNPRSVDLPVVELDGTLVNGLDNSMYGATPTDYRLSSEQKVFSPEGYLVLPVWIDERKDEYHYSTMEDDSLFTELKYTTANLFNLIT